MRFRRLLATERIEFGDELWEFDGSCVTISDMWAWIPPENKRFGTSWIGQLVGSRIVRRPVDRRIKPEEAMDRDPTQAELLALPYPYAIHVR